MTLLDQYFKEIEKELSEEGKTKIKTDEVGVVTQIKDGVTVLEGLDNISFGELIQFASGTMAMVIDLLPDQVGAVVLGEYENIRAGDIAKATGRTLSIPVADALLGRVVNPLGDPEDGGAKIKSEKYNPLEKIAAGIVYRKMVSVPLQTGMKAIDALVPIGRGQRELIIGDRGVGKTTLAIDAIINQKSENVVCIYCAIGQKNSKIASIVELLKKHKAMDHTIVIKASASDPATTQFIAPYAATAIAEFFMEKGRDVLVVYDDLSKHAWAYREVSLILRRPAGREAYPGDVFYLHSRLLERSCRMDEKYGGGSITALPIIETLAGDVSAYIPTNVISITDGQIFLDGDLFNAGIRPAINVGISVSRVGGNAQTKAMKSVASRMKLDLAQYREMAAFSQFESELDESTKNFLNRGARITQILKQKQHQIYSLSEQVAIIWAVTNGLLDKLDVSDIEKFEEKFIYDLRVRGKKITERINKNKVVVKEDEAEIKKLVEENLNI